ncbi:hypothetical protein Cst_c16760 [Thermoclostridium stercorarium subsp. stercorarium DSM 8532]|uniref:Uncharacterized protein n=1 Tax=Thermoclostridium stercorarium (strain ATCC 35414 / DSM 8532 / NCIMB 11754) TaxID=1121335 RepID=L7VKM2_THES1|nr:hypothetical protein Cst_c16760 [Thermoclostridium stercorarium subsp. stercorarium DSM 8532]
MFTEPILTPNKCSFKYYFMVKKVSVCMTLVLSLYFQKAAREMKYSFS